MYTFFIEKQLIEAEIIRDEDEFIKRMKEYLKTDVLRA